MNKFELNQLLEKYGDNPALIWPNGELTYHQYFQRINYISASLKKKEIQPGSKVAVISEISYHFPILFFAILVSGGIVVPINPKIPEEKIHNLLKEISCDLVISFDNSFSTDPQNKISILSGTDLFEISSEIATSENITSLRFEDKSTITFTSGSQGNPRGVLHTVGNHYYSAIGSNQNIPLNQNDRWMITLPFYHIAGIAILFRTMIAGAALFIPASVKDFSCQLKNQNVTHLSLVSTQLHRLISNTKLMDSAVKDKSIDTINHVSTFNSLKAILLGGSQIPKNFIEQSLKQELPIFASYGSTEMCSQITTTSGDDLKKNPSSSGKLLSHRELKIDKKGEILVKGSTLGLGYVSGDDSINFVDSNGWYHTGDLGRFDDMENLVVTGRQDNMFISGGENIQPEEIEHHLQLMENISYVCVVDIPDSEYGARPVAFIKMAGSDKINETDLKNYLKDKIAGFKIPVRFFACPDDLDTLKPDRKYFQKLAIKNLGL